MGKSGAFCSNGIPGVEYEDNVCCEAQCGTCGGDGCETRPGGEVRCCLPYTFAVPRPGASAEACSLYLPEKRPPTLNFVHKPVGLVRRSCVPYQPLVSLYLTNACLDCSFVYRTPAALALSARTARCVALPRRRPA